MNEPIELRPEVQWFAEQMELRLRANDWKGGWRDEDIDWLWARMWDEERELYQAMHPSTWPEVDYDGIVKEAADVANFAMMVADTCRPKGTP